jgi:hypothetical protein
VQPVEEIVFFPDAEKSGDSDDDMMDDSEQGIGPEVRLARLSLSFSPCRVDKM